MKIWTKINMMKMFLLNYYFYRLHIFNNGETYELHTAGWEKARDTQPLP